MGFMDAFTPDTKIEVKFADFFSLVKEATKAELMMNAVNCNVPHAFIRETMTGTPEQQGIKVINTTILANAAAPEERARQKEEDQDPEQVQEDQAESEGTDNGNE